MHQKIRNAVLKVAAVAVLTALSGNCFDAENNFKINKTVMDGLLKKMDYLNIELQNASQASNSYVGYLLAQTECPVQIFTAAHVFNESQLHRAVALTSQELPAVLQRHASRAGTLLCIFYDTPHGDELLRISHRLWQTQGIFKVFYLSPGKQVFFNPFAMLNGGFGDLVDLSATDIDGIFDNLNGYPLRVYIFDSVYSTVYGEYDKKEISKVEGADGNVAKLLSKMMNFTMDLKWPDDEFFGWRLQNGSYNGAIGRMMRYEIDIALTGFFVKDYLTREIEFSVSVYMDELCCYVQKAKRVPQSILPLFAVDVKIWLSFLLVGMISPLIWIVIRKCNLTLRIERLDTSRQLFATKFQFMRIFIDTWVVWVRVNIVRFPPFYSERIFVISLCLMSVIFGAIFESSLATVYIRPLYYKDINTMEELDESNFKIYIKHAAMKDDLFYGSSTVVYQNLDRKLLLVAELEERLISMMSKRGGFAAVTRASSLNLNDIRYFITKKIHKIPECPKNYHIAFVLPKKSPFEKPINVLLLRFVQAGLIDQWIDEMKHRAKILIHNFPDYVAEGGDKWKVLTLRDLQLPFYVLLFGSTVSGLVFVGEYGLGLRWKYYISRQKRVE